MKVFAKRLHELRTERGIEIQALATKLGLHYTTVLRYERNEAKPSIETIILLADFFGVSTDYLFGRADI
ncbi:MAG: helix-turn-helix domain-containing protein [Firmicutes bacterium]|nr:helix-turn-helix domain-containing protein [Bacillota bacterium]